MKFLLDTHTFLWLESNQTELSPAVLDIVDDPQNILLLSYASLWEIQIKTAIGKLGAELPFVERVQLAESRSHLTLLLITVEHIATVGDLPLHHRDPFDRMLIAQAIHEQVPILSKDSKFQLYGVPVVW